MHAEHIAALILDRLFQLTLTAPSRVSILRDPIFRDLPETISGTGTVTCTMTSRDLTPDEVNSLLDEHGQLRPDTIPLVSQTASPASSFLTSSLPLASKIRQPLTSERTEPDGDIENNASSALSSFAVQQRPPLEQLKAATAQAAKIWGASLAQPLRTTVQLDVEDAQACHAGLSSQYELPGCIQVLHVNPLGETIYLQMDRGIVFGMIDRLLGGGKSPLPNVRRAITEIQTSLLLRITASLRKALEGLFPASAAQSISTLRVESNPQCIPLRQPGYYQLRIRVTWERFAGTMRLVLPEVVLRMLAENVDSDPAEAACLPAEGVSVVAGQITLRRDEADRLKVGDTILLTRPRVRVYVDRKRMYAGKLGSVQQHKAVRIEEELDS